MRPPRGGRRFAVMLTATLAVSGIGVSSAPGVLAAPEADPAAMGSWTLPFEEGGSGTPRCEIINDPEDAADPSPERLECKPTAVTSAMLPDGRVLYGNGLESEENAEEGIVAGLAPETRSDRTRTVDLRDGSPAFDIPENERSDGDNPTIVEGRTSDDCLTDPENLPGVAGVPGRPGDGLVGSLAGQTGVIPEQEPTCAPDDVQNNDGNIFCGDIAQMADGRQLLVGGTDYYNEPSVLEQAEGDPINLGVVELEGLRSARIFDHTAGDDGLGRWDATTPMKFGRWYPSLVAMGDGGMMAFGGTVKLVKSTQLSQVRRAETYDPDTTQWTENFTGIESEKTLPQNARMYLAPNGQPFYSGDGQMFGPLGQAADEALFAQQGFFDPETNTWNNRGVTIPRSSPASFTLPMRAPYDELTIMRAGGTLGPPPATYVAVPTSELTTVDAEGNVTNTPGPNLNNARWFPQPTPLPTGETLITHGARNDEVIFPGIELPVKTPEIYDPETNGFREVALPERARTYHNNALLLPNGQVLVGGNSPISLGYGVQRDALPGVTANNDKDPSFELYNPPYLHQDVARPSIERVDAGLSWKQAFDITTKDASEIEKVTLMRVPSPQHVMDNDARTLELEFVDDGDGSLTATMPPSPDVAPPGFYYVFINRSDGNGGYVPSVARMVQVSDASDTSEAPEPMSEETVTDFTGNGATPVEANTLLGNPPNPMDTPTVPGETDPLAPFPPGTPGINAPVPDLTGQGIDEGYEETPPGSSEGAPAEGAAPPVNENAPEGTLGGLTGNSDGRRRRATSRWSAPASHRTDPR